MPFIDVLFGLAALACFAGALFIALNPSSKSSKQTYANPWENGSVKNHQPDSKEKLYAAVKEETN